MTTPTRSPRSSKSPRPNIRADYYGQRELVGGVLVSPLLGTEGHPEHGTASGADWYGCCCDPCRDALAGEPKRASRRASERRRRTDLANARKPLNDTPGAPLVSTLLGTEGHPAHGAYEGYTDYLCRCDDCTKANRETHRRYRQRYSPAGKAAAAVLAEHWPGRPGRGHVNALAGDVAARWQDVRRDTEGRTEALALLLDDHPAWSATDDATRVRVADELATALAAPRT